MSEVVTRAEIRNWTRVLFAAEPRLTPWRQLLRLQICPYENLLSCLPPGSDVLDIGCGAGLFLGLLCMRDANIQAKGIDSSRAAISCATRVAERMGLEGLTFQQTDRTDDWPQERYPVVSLIDTLHHVPDNSRELFFQKAASRVNCAGEQLRAALPLVPTQTLC